MRNQINFETTDEVKDLIRKIAFLERKKIGEVANELIIKAARQRLEKETKTGGGNG
jgi:uncharacterized protein (DUF1778 family)